MPSRNFESVETLGCRMNSFSFSTGSNIRRPCPFHRPPPIGKTGLEIRGRGRRGKARYPQRAVGTKWHGFRVVEAEIGALRGAFGMPRRPITPLSLNFTARSRNFTTLSGYFCTLARDFYPLADNFYTQARNFHTLAHNFRALADDFTTRAKNFTALADNFRPRAHNFRTLTLNFCALTGNFMTLAANFSARLRAAPALTVNFMTPLDDFRPHRCSSRGNEAVGQSLRFSLVTSAATSDCMDTAKAERCSRP